ncbi:class I SAM-dependent methyltransferase [Oscillospiraceae bacterium CM]|nr:class I SAM-dependent methyltransferase [Oscillospiraceae bacterium CM]
MWLSDKWTDYELLDCSGGEKLERWGSFLLVRPDPQAIWDTPKCHPGWKKPDARYARSSSGGGRWEKSSLPESWQISYDDLKFNIKPMSFKHTGLFPEQAANWDFIRDKIGGSTKKISVLNLFAYTGGATVAALAAGAAVCHVDAARGMVSWARENARTSGLDGGSVRWIIDDCVKFLEREIRRGRRYDALIMDPPSYGRGPSGEVWKLEDDLFPLVQLTADVLSDDALFVLINSYTTGLSPATLTYMAETVYTKRFGGRAESRELGLPVTESGLVLPCGATCRWER